MSYLTVNIYDSSYYYYWIIKFEIEATWEQIKFGYQ